MARNYTPRGSAPEKKLFLALKEIYPDAESSVLLEDVRLAKKHLVWVDIFVPSLKLVVEYDGAYWHYNRRMKDVRKTKEIIKKGYRVVRVREATEKIVLPVLPHRDPHLLQVFGSGSDSRIAGVVAAVRAFVEETSPVV